MERLIKYNFMFFMFFVSTELLSQPLLILPMKVYGETTKKTYETELNIFPFVYQCKDIFFLSGQYEASIQWLKKDTSIANYMVEYCIASSYAKLDMIDSAFYHLDMFLDISPDDRMVIIDDTWNILRKDTQKWQFVTNKIEGLYLQELDSGVNKGLVLELFYMGIRDQEYRLYRPSLHQLSKDSTEATEVLQGMINRNERLREILREYGFPSISMVGHLGNLTAFLLLQHSTYLGRYYHLVKKSYKSGEIRPMFYAMITDRHLMRLHRKQIYGSQFYQSSKDEKGKYALWRVKDFEHVNERRKEMGFPTTVEENAKRSNTFYIPEKYYKKRKI
ncbi:MAG: hypothetical protein LBG80_10110 [Bacteroidales bacterium]|jgi:hypothetical protein|nr:hypothetical protein [Bacteroidales bacterium]